MVQMVYSCFLAVTTQDSSPPLVVRKRFLLRALPPAAAKPAAKKQMLATSSGELPSYVRPKRLTNEEGRATIMLTDDHDYTWGGDETVDIGDLKSPERKLVWVRVPPALLSISYARC